MKYRLPVFLVLVPFFSGGCAGHDSLLFVTKTNVGIDIDTKPPTAEITIARREGVIEPSFGGGEIAGPKTLPVLAGFNIHGIWNPRIYGVFAGGDAAIGATEDPSSRPPAPISLGDGSRPQVERFQQAREAGEGVCLDEKPKINPFTRFIIWLTGNSGVTRAPFYFATDTSFGLKLGWSGTTGAAPDTVKLGYNRKEFALAPVHVQDVAVSGLSNGLSDSERSACKYYASTPSFLAKIDNSSGFAGTPTDLELGHSQIFATGTASRQLARRASLQRAFFEQIAPEAALIESSTLNSRIRSEIGKLYGSLGSAAKEDAVVQEAVRLRLVKFDDATASSPASMRGAFLKSLEGMTLSSRIGFTQRLDELRRLAASL